MTSGSDYEMSGPETYLPTLVEPKRQNPTSARKCYLDVSVDKDRMSLYEWSALHHDLEIERDRTGNNNSISIS